MRESGQERLYVVICDRSGMSYDSEERTAWRDGDFEIQTRRYLMLVLLNEFSASVVVS